jgi:hypothetical protein
MKIATPAATMPAMTPAAIDRLAVSVGTFLAARLARVRTERTALFASSVNACARVLRAVVEAPLLLVLLRLRVVERLPVDRERVVVVLVGMASLRWN